MTGDEKCEWVIWNESMMFWRMSCGSVYWENLRGSFLGILYLYRWYNHATSCSKDSMGGSKLCDRCKALWYCSHNHWSLCSEIVIKCRPSASYICKTPCWLWMVGWVRPMSLSGLHSLIWMWHRGVTCSGGMCRVSRSCASWNFEFKMWVHYRCCLRV